MALIVPLALGACGRKGALDPPPSAATPPPPALQPQPAPSTTGLIDPLTPTGEAQQALPPPVQTTPGPAGAAATEWLPARPADSVIRRIGAAAP